MSDIYSAANEAKAKKHEQSKFKRKQKTSRNLEQKVLFNTTGQHYTPTPLSVLQENGGSGLGTHSLLRNSLHDSEVSVDRLQIKQQESSGQNSIGGPYLR